MKNPWIAPVTALVVGAAGGYLSGKNTTLPATPSAAEQTSLRTKSSSRPDASAGEMTKKVSRVTNSDKIIRMPGNSNRVQALMEFYAGLTPDQLSEEAAKLENLPTNERMMGSFLLFGRWAEVDPTAAMAFSNTMGMAGGFVRPTILQSWASVDPANAAKYYQQNPREFAMMDMMGGGGRGPMGGQGASSIIATEWARQDPAAAFAWANSLQNGKGQAMAAVVSEVAKTDPKKASEMLTGMESGDKAGAYRAVAEQYGASDFSGAQAWIKSLPAGEQDNAMAAALGGLSNEHPEQAALEAKNMAAGDAKNRLIADIASDWARKDPRSASEFIKSQDDDAQRGAMRQLIPAWTGQDPAAALAFVNSYSEGPVRDSAAQAYIWSNTTTPPAQLMKVAESITDDGDRDRSIGITAMRWMREDETAAKAYIQSSSLDDGAKERILSGNGGWGGGRRNGGGRER